jgi:hypothetical protein
LVGAVQRKTPGGTISGGSLGCHRDLVMPFVFLAGVAAAAAYLWRGRHQQTAPRARGRLSPTAIRSGLVAQPGLVGIRGWLAVYVVGLAAELAHGLALTIGSLVIYAKPALAGLHSFIPLWALLIYVVSNLALVAYGVALFVLMRRKRQAAI